MGSLLLAVIYLAFVSLGLPDSLLGSGWSVMQKDFGVPSSYAGYVSMAISFMTIISAQTAAAFGSLIFGGRLHRQHLYANGFRSHTAGRRHWDNACLSDGVCRAEYRNAGVCV